MKSIRAQKKSSGSGAFMGTKMGKTADTVRREPLCGVCNDCLIHSIRSGRKHNGPILALVSASGPARAEPSRPGMRSDAPILRLRTATNGEGIELFSACRDEGTLAL